MSNGKWFGVSHVVWGLVLGAAVGCAGTLILLKTFPHLARDLFRKDFLKQMNNGNSPVKVGGGAISFQSDKSGDTWQKQSDGSYCLTNPDSTQIFVPTQIKVHLAGADGGSTS